MSLQDRRTELEPLAEAILQDQVNEIAATCRSHSGWAGMFRQFCITLPLHQMR